jgi:hypothetical protein
VGLWELESDEFAALWLGPANDVFPPPLRYQSRHKLLVEWENARHHTLQHYRPAEFDSLRAALAVLTAPLARVEVVGTTEDSGGEIRVRMLGASDNTGAVVALQRHTPARSPTGNIVLRSGPAGRLPMMMARSLPSTVPGKQEGGVFYRADVERRADRSVLAPVTGATAMERYEAIVAVPRDLTIRARSYPGPAWSTPTPVAEFQVFDVSDDGRYLRHGRDPIVISPVTAPDLTEQFRSALDGALAVAAR